MARILVTGAAGFIGLHLVERLLARGDSVYGIDNLNPYYEVSLKEARLRRLEPHPGFRFQAADLADPAALAAAFESARPDVVVNLAAQVGVRYSLTNPQAYVQSNLVGFANVLEGCRRHAVEHLVFASSSSVYGANTAVPSSVHHGVDHPISLYAATKKSNELMAHTYSHLYGIPVTGLRFFTVYGPWGRPDMAPFLFTRAILEGRPIDLFNEGRMRRDFTYVDDVAEGVARVIDRVPVPNPEWDPARPDPGRSRAPYRVYNIGHNEPVELLRFVELLERSLGVQARRKLLPLQPGDVIATCADVSDLERDVGYKPCTSIEEGVPKFVAWYREYYRTSERKAPAPTSRS